MILQLPRKCTAYIAYLPRPATHTTPAGRVLDGVRDQTQGSASHAFSCTGPGLVPVLPARCHRYVGASSSLRSGYCVLLIPSSYQKALLQYPTNNCKCGKDEYQVFCCFIKLLACFVYKIVNFVTFFLAGGTDFERYVHRNHKILET